jgi:hypothetical protein
MNRKERRQNGINTPPKTLCITEHLYRDKLLAMYEQGRLYGRGEVLDSVGHITIGVMALSLNGTFGFGKKRTNRLIERMNKDISCIESGHLSADDVLNWCKANNIDL